MKLGAYTITITVDDQVLEEYKVSEVGSTVTCWVACEEGKAFKVVFEQEVGWTSRSTAARIYLDGSVKPSATSLFDPTKARSHISGRRTSSTQILPFVFQPITTTDEDTLGTTAVSDGFGSISIALNRGTPGETIEHDPRRASPSAAAYHELSVKKQRVSTVCGFGQSVAAPRSVTSTFNYHDAKEHPLHTFVFKYRSKSLLEAMEIVPASAPRSLSPQPNAQAGPSRTSGSDKGNEVDSSNDGSDIDAQIQAAEAALEAAIASKKARTTKAPRKGVKPEPKESKHDLSRDSSPDPVPFVPRKKRAREIEVIVLSD